LTKAAVSSDVAAAFNRINVSTNEEGAHPRLLAHAQEVKGICMNRNLVYRIAVTVAVAVVDLLAQKFLRRPSKPRNRPKT